MAEIFAQRAKIGRYVCTKSRRLAEMFALGVRAEDWKICLQREQQIGRDVYTKSRILAEIFALRAADWQRCLH